MVVKRTPLASTALVALLGSACGAGMPATDAPPSERPAPAPEPLDPSWAPFAESLDLEVGTGASGFEPLEDGATMILERGSQGLQHVYVGLRAEVPPGFRRVTLAITPSARPEAPWLVAPVTLRVPWSASPGRPGWSELTGLALVVEAPDALIDAGDCYLHIRVADGDAGGDRGGQATRRVRVDWTR